MLTLLLPSLSSRIVPQVELKRRSGRDSTTSSGTDTVGVSGEESEQEDEELEPDD